MHRLILVLLLSPCVAIADPVTVGDREWRQLTETTNLSWAEVLSVCSETTGECAGTFDGVDYSGWTWATVFEVGDLFSTLTPHPGGIAFYAEAGSTWAPDFLSLFDSTLGGFLVQGWTRSRTGIDSGAYAPVLYVDVQGSDVANTSITFDTLAPQGVSRAGVWLYRGGMSVPEPSTLALLGIGLFGMGWARRRLRVSKLIGPDEV